MNSICKTNKKGSKFWVIPNTENDESSYNGYGILHREDGPAIEFDGVNIFHIGWRLNDKRIDPSFEMMEKYIKLNPDNILKIYHYPLEIQKLAISLKPSVIFSIKYPDPKLKELYPKLFALKESGLI